jgi:hypothetical protein
MKLITALTLLVKIIRSTKEDKANGFVKSYKSLTFQGKPATDFTNPVTLRIV